jgi:hypothetical protein
MADKLTSSTTADGDEAATCERQLRAWVLPVLVFDERGGLTDTRCSALKELSVLETHQEYCEKQDRAGGQNFFSPWAIKRRKAALNDRVTRLAYAYGKPARVALCANIQSSLPVELRDRIYEFLIEDETTRVKIHGDRDFNCACLKLDYAYESDREIDGLPLCWIKFDVLNRNFYNTTAFDVATLTEVVKTWYRYGVLAVYDWRMLAPILASDKLGIGMPTKDLVRAMLISIDEFDIIGSPNASPQEAFCRQWGESHGTHLDNLVGALRSLEGLGKGAAVVIWLSFPDYLLVQTRVSRSQEYLRTLHALFATLKTIQTKDIDVLVFTRMSAQLNDGEDDQQVTLQMIRMLNQPLTTVEVWLQRIAAFPASSAEKQEMIVATRIERKWQAVLDI